MNKTKLNQIKPNSTTSLQQWIWIWEPLKDYNCIIGCVFNNLLKRERIEWKKQHDHHPHHHTLPESIHLPSECGWARRYDTIRYYAMPWSFCSKSLEHKLALNSWTISSLQSNQISTLLWHAYSLSGILCKRNFVYEYMLLYKLLVWMVHLSNSYYTHLTHNLILMVVAAAPKPLNVSYTDFTQFKHIFEWMLIELFKKKIYILTNLKWRLYIIWMLNVFSFFLHTSNWYFILLQYEVFFLIVSITYNEINKIEFQTKHKSDILFPFRFECFIQAI